ncbi:methyltransferase domain-containing protein [Solirubrobacter phytolaccae]|uniref:Methyltransferase domain-containing protein n=1 Tax=Solirubrobacter phytolaccae TaxID=1404360 RepID=A0A9X3S9R2_9ACTN|nr:methyltransferase domain-containing protein [Solirubrobacter phytolaccae]MDA0183664.1 methyltransferase domain-containing protein [Solirubrobacter phytolaccae]
MDVPAPLVRGAALLRCPVCSAPLELHERSLVCDQRHTYDISRHGHVTLARAPAPGDDAAMVAARAAVFDAGHYAPLTAALARAATSAASDGDAATATDDETLEGGAAAGGDAAGGGEAARGDAATATGDEAQAGEAAAAGDVPQPGEATASRDEARSGQAGAGDDAARPDEATASGDAARPGQAAAGGAAAGPGAASVVLDIGAGTGHHLAGVLEARPGALGIALDTSRPALRLAARAHPDIAAVVGDVWEALPLQDGVVDLALVVFAPRNGGEIARVLRPGGTALVVIPTPEHLAELAHLHAVQVDPEKPERLERTLGAHLQHTGTEAVRWTMQLSQQDVEHVIRMSPAGAHRGEAEAHAATVTGSVELRTYRSPDVGGGG